MNATKEKERSDFVRLGLGNGSCILDFLQPLEAAHLAPVSLLDALSIILNISNRGITWIQTSKVTWLLDLKNSTEGDAEESKLCTHHMSESLRSDENIPR